MTELALATIAHNEPRLIAEQIRLIDKYLSDDTFFLVFDTSTEQEARDEIADLCTDGIGYGSRFGIRLHHEGLNAAAGFLLATGLPYFGFIDHDVFPTRPTTLVDKIAATGFYGVGQRHAPTGHLYLWPGFCFFSREWLNGRPLDFEGIRAERKKDDGDTGSGLWPLFKDEPWEKMYQPEHSYRIIREPDGYGLQSYGYEVIGDWIHLTNGSHWMNVPDGEGRDRILFEMLAEL